MQQTGGSKRTRPSRSGRTWEVAAPARPGDHRALDPITLARMEVWLGERFMGLAVRCDKHRNSKLHITTNDYDREIY